MRYCIAYVLVLGAGVVILGCGEPGTTVRLSPDQELSVETGLNSKDFLSMTQRLARSMNQYPAFGRANNQAPPTIAFESIKNNTADVINTSMFLDEMRTNLLKYSEGRWQFADRELIATVDDENEAKKNGDLTGQPGRLLGADFFLTGQIASIGTTAGTEKVTYWRLSFRLTSATTTGVVWQDKYEIKKQQHRGLGE